MDLLAAPLIIVAGLAVLIALVGGPGWIIQYRRKRSIARTLAALQDRPAPFLPVERTAVDEYVSAVAEAAHKTLAGIDAALADFEAAGRLHYGEGYVQPDKLPGVKVRTHGVPGDMAKATRVALVRLRVGFHEPVTAYRPGNTPTGMHTMRGLWELLAAEESPVPA